MTRLFTTALGSAAMLLGLFAALLLTAGVITLIGAFLPNAGMAAMGILIAPWLLLFGGAGLVAARGTWRRQRGSQISGIVFALVLALATGAAGLSALGIGRGHRRQRRAPAAWQRSAWPRCGTPTRWWWTSPVGSRSW